MSAVDVLAVLGKACELHANGAYADAWEVGLDGIAEARAAVAELIEAAEAAHHHLKELRRRVSATSHDDADYLTEVESDTSALHAALAGVGGAK